MEEVIVLQGEKNSLRTHCSGGVFPSKTDLLETEPDALEKRVQTLGEPSYRARQILGWVYRGETRIEEMTDLSKSFRQKLAEQFYISRLILSDQKEAEDGTRKFIFRLEDGQPIESVLIRMEDRWTLCLSTQVGCRMGCRFCLTGARGFIRNLRASEITGQILAVRRFLPSDQHPCHWVLMGMGEPLDNYDNVIQALRRISSPIGLNLSPRRMTLSTVGLMDRLQKLAGEDLGINLAISLNAATDELRRSLMPVAQGYSLKELLSLCKGYPLPPRRRITIQYVLIRDVNDSPEEAQRLALLLRGLRCKINLIPLNPFEGLEWQPPTPNAITRFQEVLIAAGYTALIRQSKGAGICGACGQLGDSIHG